MTTTHKLYEETYQCLSYAIYVLNDTSVPVSKNRSLELIQLMRKHIQYFFDIYSDEETLPAEAIEKIYAGAALSFEYRPILDSSAFSLKDLTSAPTLSDIESSTSSLSLVIISDCGISGMRAVLSIGLYKNSESFDIVK